MTGILQITRINNVKSVQCGDKMWQEGQGKNVVRVVHTCCWEIKVTKVLQNLSNLKVGQGFFNVYFGRCKVSFYTWSFLRAARRLDTLKKLFRFLPDAHRTLVPLASEEWSLKTISVNLTQLFCTHQGLTASTEMQGKTDCIPKNFCIRAYWSVRKNSDMRTPMETASCFGYLFSVTQRL